MVSLLRNPGETSDRELAVCLAEVARAMQWHSDQHHRRLVDGLHTVAVALADERDMRQRRSREADASWADITDLLRWEESDVWPWPGDGSR